jgi:hypothetical protein
LTIGIKRLVNLESFPLTSLSSLNENRPPQQPYLPSQKYSELLEVKKLDFVIDLLVESKPEQTVLHLELKVVQTFLQLPQLLLTLCFLFGCQLHFSDTQLFERLHNAFTVILVAR